MEIWATLKRTIILITHDVDDAILLSDRVYVLTARPAQVSMVMEVDLPRPRDFKKITDPDFVELKARLLSPLLQETAKQV